MLVSGVNAGDSDDSLTMIVALGVILAVVLLVIIVASVTVAVHCVRKSRRKPPGDVQSFCRCYFIIARQQTAQLILLSLAASSRQRVCNLPSSVCLSRDCEKFHARKNRRSVCRARLMFRGSSSIGRGDLTQGKPVLLAG